MIHLIEQHGIEALIVYYLLISVLGTMPPVPDSGTYLQRWAYAAAQAFCGNVKNLAATFKDPATKGN